MVVVVREDEEGTDKRLKTANATRLIPVHPELVKFGFLAYVRMMKAQGETRVFPELSKGKTGYYSDPYQKWFKRLMASVNATAPRTSFHSFRHSFRDALREAGITEEIVRQLCGWSGSGMESTYGSGFKPSTLANEIAKVAYPELALHHLHV